MIESTEMSDEAAFALFMQLLEDRVTITTGFVVDPDTSIVKQEVLQIQCGELVAYSAPATPALTLQVIRNTGETIQ